MKFCIIIFISNFHIKPLFLFLFFQNIYLVNSLYATNFTTKFPKNKILDGINSNKNSKLIINFI